MTSSVLPYQLDLTMPGIWPAEASSRKLDARQNLELAIVTARTSGQLATKANANLRRIARQLGQLQTGVKAVLNRRFGSIGGRLERSRLVGVLNCHPGPLFVPLD